MEPWKVYRIVVADSHHFEEELDPDPDESDRIRIIVNSWIRIKVMRIHNPCKVPGVPGTS
jgi:hypothetical protein